MQNAAIIDSIMRSRQEPSRQEALNLDRFVEPTVLFVSKMSRVTESTRVQQMKKKLIRPKENKGGNEGASHSMNQYKESILSH